jgi:hypothetical protein
MIIVPSSNLRIDGKTNLTWRNMSAGLTPCVGSV